MEIYCDFCNKKVEKRGEIHDGKAYHEHCKRKKFKKEFEDVLSVWAEKLPGLPEEALANILEEDISSTQELGHPWLIVFYGEFAQIDIEGYHYKREVIERLEDFAENMLNDGDEDYTVEYILYQGKQRYNFNDTVNRLRVKVDF